MPDLSETPRHRAGLGLKWIGIVLLMLSVVALLFGASRATTSPRNDFLDLSGTLFLVGSASFLLWLAVRALREP